MLIGLKEVTVIGNLLLERGKKSWQFGQGKFPNILSDIDSLLVSIPRKWQLLRLKIFSGGEGGMKNKKICFPVRTYFLFKLELNICCCFPYPIWVSPLLLLSLSHLSLTFVVTFLIPFEFNICCCFFFLFNDKMLS